MKRWILIVGLAAGLGGSFLVAGAEITPIERLVGNEQSFALRSRQFGLRSAFVEFLTENSVVFRPLPTNGRQWALGLEESPDSLLWEPDFARISRRGDLGVSAGPWDYTSLDSVGQVAGKTYGHFLSVWEAQDTGGFYESMRVILDIGVSHPKPEGPPVYDFRADTSGGDVKLYMGSELQAQERSLLAAEKKLVSSVARSGFGEALAKIATPDLRVYRAGTLPTVGVEPARQGLAGDRARWKWAAPSVRVARSGDLGYVYGVAVARSKAGTDSATFVRVWQRNPGKDWRVLLDLQVPVRRRS